MEIDKINQDLVKAKKQERERERSESDRQFREEQRKREREEERERRDPTPVIHPYQQPAALPYGIRDQHIYVPGGTRRGKSSLLLRIIIKDIENGQGVAVLDPKGDLIRSICRELPAERMVNGEKRQIVDDCIYLDLNTPVPLDLMGHTDAETNKVINDLIYVVTKGDANLPAAEPLLERALRSLLCIEGTTFLDVFRFFTQRDRRATILEALKRINPELHESWNPFPSAKDYGPIVRRIERYYWNPTFKTIFGASQTNLSISRVMDEQRILLVNLSPADQDTRLYGSLIVSKFQQAALRRANFPKSKRTPFFLFIDEFEHFQTESFADIFSMAGGLGLRLAIGNQYLDQLLPQNLSAIVGNAGSYIIFQLGPKDAPLFKNIMSPYDYSHLERLAPHQAVFKIGANSPIFKWTIPPRPMTEQDELYAEKMIEVLREHTLAKYGPKQATSAGSGQNRNGDKASCNSQQTGHDVRNGHSTTCAEKPEVQPAGAPSNIPPHENKA
jgi:hypothetical protein